MFSDDVAPRSADLTIPHGHSHQWSLQKTGYLLLFAQAVGLVAWSSLLASRFSLTFDFAIYHQAVWLIQHGKLNPFDSIVSYQFWRSHGEFIMWPVASLGIIWPRLPTLLWIQDLALVASELIAFNWIYELLTLRNPSVPSLRAKRTIVVCGLILLIANPWIYLTISFDFHVEVIGVFFMTLVGWSLYRDPKSSISWIWVILALACGDVVSSYLFAFGLGIATLGPQWRRRGLAISAISVIWLFILSKVGANQGSGLLAGYGYLQGTFANSNSHLGLSTVAAAILMHPLLAIQHLWERRNDIYAIFAPSGFLGILNPLLIPISLLIIAENGLNSRLTFLAPGFQDCALFVFIPIGTVIILRQLLVRHRAVASVIAILLSLNTVCWAIIWLPQLPSQWLRVSGPAASTLAEVKSAIPQRAEVVASQGVVGAFSSRQWIYAINGPGNIPIHAHNIWIVVTPIQGIETAPVPVSDALITELLNSPSSKLVANKNGVWAFQVDRAKMRVLKIPRAPTSLSAFMSPGAAGHSVVSPIPQDSRVVSNGKSGYVYAGDYWPENRGRFRASVTLKTSRNVNIEVWNTTGNVLIARHHLLATLRKTTFTFDFNSTNYFRPHVYRGIFPYTATPVAPPKKNTLEIRVWSPGHGRVVVYSVSLKRTG